MTTDSNCCLTLIVPTYNRCQFLRRLLDYYVRKKFRHPILVADSSFSEAVETNENTVRHASRLIDIRLQRFTSNTPPIPKLAAAAARIRTEFAAVCADDDFLCTEGLAQSVAFLQSNPDFAAAQGATASFSMRARTKSAESSFVLRRAVAPPQLDSDDPGERLFDHLSNFFFPIFFAVHRRELLHGNCQELAARPNHPRFAELLFSCLTVIRGKVHGLDALYSVRQSHDENLGQQLQSWDRFVHDEQFSQCYGSFRDVVAEGLAAVGGEDCGPASERVDRAFQAFLRRMGLSHGEDIDRRATIRNRLVHFIKKCGPIAEQLRAARAVVRQADAKLRLACWRNFTGRAFRAELSLLEKLVLEHQDGTLQPQTADAA
jgi:glycosyltransferase domain-containing protein